MGARFEVDVRSNAPQLAMWLGEAIDKQIPFATAVALTRLAQEGRDEQRRGMRERFEIRNKRVLRGVGMQRAEKRDWPNPTALVFTKDDFIAEHEKGVIRKPLKATHRAAPNVRDGVIKRTKTGKVPVSRRPKRLMEGKRAYRLPIGGGKEAIFVRRGRKGKTSSAVAYVLAKRAVLTPRLRMRDTVDDVVRTRYAHHFIIELSAALGSQKRTAIISSAGGRQAYLRSRGRLGSLPSTFRPKNVSRLSF